MKRRYNVRTVALLLVLPLYAAALLAQTRERTWVPLVPNAKPNAPAVMQVVETSPTQTQLDFRLPGVWVTVERYADRLFSRIELPPVQLEGKGLPTRSGERGWYDFPPALNQPARDPLPFRDAVGVGAGKPLFPRSALGSKPRTEEEMKRLGIDPAGARPEVLRLRGLVALSRRTTAETFSLSTEIQERQELKLEFPVIPAGYEGLDQTAPPQFGYTPPPLVDEEFYARFQGSYVGPEPEVSPLTGLGSFSGALLNVPAYELVTPTLVKVPSYTTFLVKHLAGAEDFTCPLSWDVWSALPPFLNGQAILDALTVKGLAIEASRSAHYLILTPRVWRPNLEAFARWKQSKGLNVDFAYVGSSKTDDVAPDWAAMDAWIESYFHDHYCHGVYVLLVGDVDVLPTGRSAQVTAGPDGADADSDHVYEVLGDDLLPSLYVGRLSVNTAAELDTQLAKILSYERTPAAGNWPRWATLAANSQNDDGTFGVSASHPSKYAQAVNDIASYGGYTAAPNFELLHAGASSAATTRAVNADVVNAVKAGRGHLLYRGHGDSLSWTYGWDGSGGSTSTGSPLTDAHVALLSNLAYPVVYGIACQTARLRVSDALGEDFMNRSGGGAVAYFGASVDSATTENHQRAKGLFRAIYDTGFTRLGPAIAQAETFSLLAVGNTASWRNNTFCYLLLGDPELTLRKQAVPRTFNLKASLRTIGDLAQIDLTDLSGAPVAGAFVHLNLSEGADPNGFTGPDGTLRWPKPSVPVLTAQVIADGYLVQEFEVTSPGTDPVWLPLDGQSQPGTPPRFRVLKSTRDATTLELTFPGVFIETTEYGGQRFAKLNFQAVDLAGPGFPTQPGERGWYDFPAGTGYPALDPAAYRQALEIAVAQPVFPQSALGKNPTTERELLALGLDPAGARPGIPVLRGFVAMSRKNTPNDVSVQIKPTTQRVDLPYPLAPAGYTGSDAAGAQTAPNDGYLPDPVIDAEFYSKFVGEYQGPTVPLSTIGGLGGAFSGAELNVPLVTVITASTVELAAGVVIELKHLQGVEDFDCPLGWDHWLFKLPFINGEAIRESLTAKGLAIEASRSAHYLILTPREWRTALNGFALWKQAKGLNVDFAYVGNAATDDVRPDRAQIDAYLERYFRDNYCHGVYVLLVGDVDVIPSGRSTRVDAGPDGADADSDHVYEVLGDDRFPSLYVGRLSCNSVEELEVQLAKILAYERQPIGGDWPTRATLCANSENDDGTRGVSASFPSKYAQAVNDVAGYGSYTGPPTFQVLHAGASSAAAARAVNQDVINALDAGRGHVLYRGHGSGSAWVGGWDGSSVNGTSWSDAAHVNNLTNRVHPIVYSIACQNARLRNSDCVAERWLSRSGGGAVAHFGASVNSYTSENHNRAKGIFRALYESGFTRLGPALAEAERISYNLSGGGGGWDNNTFCYNLLGDPELTVRRQRILTLGSLIGSLKLTELGTLITIQDTEGKLVPGAFVNLQTRKGDRRNGFSGVEGAWLVRETTPDEIVGLDLMADGYPWTIQVEGHTGARLTPLGFDRTGGFRLRLEGVPQGRYRILASQDLRQWVDLGEGEATQGSLEFRDDQAVKLPHRFYRAIQVN